MLNYRITPKAIEVLTLLARYRYLRKTFIDGLLPHRSAQGMNPTLQRLRKNGYVSLPKEQFRGYNSLYCCYIYEITPKGLDCLQQKIPQRATNLIRQRTDAPVRQFAHAMMICDGLASIEIGATAAGCEFIPIDAILERTDVPDPLRLPTRVKMEPTFSVPDGLFGIRYPSGKVWFFVYEAEHYNPVWPVADLKRASFRKKAYAYSYIAEKKPYLDQLKIPNMLYLFAFPTNARVQTAREHFLRDFESTKLADRIFLTNIPVQEELMGAPPPFPELFTTNWAIGGRIDTE